MTVYLAGPSGAVTEADRALAEAAITVWATPLCITPIVLSAINLPVAITYELWIYKSCNMSADEVEEKVLAALENLFADEKIGGDIIIAGTNGSLYHSLIESTIRGVDTKAFRVSLTTPSGDTTLLNSQVAALSTVTATINLVVD